MQFELCLQLYPAIKISSLYLSNVRLVPLVIGSKKCISWINIEGSNGTKVEFFILIYAIVALFGE